MDLMKELTKIGGDDFHVEFILFMILKAASRK